MTARSGHEAEFRQMFVQEAESRLTRLSEELLALEESTGDPELIASIFRDAHTIKGGAAVVGMEEVVVVAHAMEDILEELRSGHREATPELIDGVLAAVDGLRTMLAPAMADRDLRSDASVLAAGLRAIAAAGPEEDGAGTPAGEEPVVEEEAPALVAVPAGTPAAATELDRVQTRRTAAAHETVRVPVSRLDELVRLVGESAAAHLRIGRMLAERLNEDPSGLSEFRDLSRVLNDLQERTMRARMVPVVTITEPLQRAVRDVARSTGKNVRWEVRGEDTELDRGVLQQLTDPLLHLIRNAVDHGIEEPAARMAAGKPEYATVRLHAMQLGSEVTIAVSDDGAGIDVRRVKEQASRHGANAASMSDEEALFLVFRSGLSTASFISDVSGRGVGLDVVHTAMDRLRGRVEVASTPGEGTEFRLIVPITLAVLPCLLLVVAAQKYAIPMHSVLIAKDVSANGEEEIRAGGQPAVWVGDQTVPLSSLAATLGAPDDEHGPVVVVAGVTRRHAFRVEALLGQRDVVVKGLSPLLSRVDVLAGASVEPDGSILLVLDAPGLINRARRLRRGAAAMPAAMEEQGTASRRYRAKILVVDDALTVRELQRSILERAGYDVRTAGDGIEALSRLSEEGVDLMLTDVEMPRMGGFALTEAVRARPALANLPVVILTSRASEEDRERGLDVGADGYIVKSAFDESALLNVVARLLGR